METPSAPVPERVTWRTIPAPVRLITIAFILANLGGAMFYDQLAVWLTAELGASLSQLGTFFLVSTLFGAVVRLLGGWISDAIGHFRGLGVGSIIGLAGAILLWLASSWQWALAAYLFVVVGSSLVAPSANAAITNLTPPEIRARTFGITSSVFQIVGVLGPSVGGWVIATHGWKAAMGINALLFIGATALRTSLARLEDQTPRRPRWRIFARDMRLLTASLFVGGAFGLVLLIDICMDFQINLTWPLRSLYLEEVRQMDATGRGLLFTIGGLVGMPAMLLGGWLGDRIGELKTMLLGLGAGIIGFLLFVLLPQTAGLVAAFACWGLVGGLFEPASRALISKSVPKERLGTAFGAVWGSTSLLATPAARLGPWLYETGSPALPFLVAAGLQGLLLAALWLLLPRLERKVAADVAAVQ